MAFVRSVNCFTLKLSPRDREGRQQGARHARRACQTRPVSSLPTNAPRKMPGSWSHATCVGQLTMSLRGSQQQKWVVRNRGGGTSACCANHPVAAPARIKPTDRSVQLKLEQRADNEGSRNGARVYFADECVEGHYHPDRYTALQLLGKTFSVTLDLSSALCSCNVAWYLVPMRSNSDPGTCDGDFYCDANKACRPCRWVAQGHRPLGRLTPARIVAWKIGMASGAPSQAAKAAHVQTTGLWSELRRNGSGRGQQVCVPFGSSHGLRWFGTLQRLGRRQRPQGIWQRGVRSWWLCH